MLRSAGAIFQNLDIKAKFSDEDVGGPLRGAIEIYGTSSTIIQGKINIQTQGKFAYGVCTGSAESEICAEMSIQTTGRGAHGIYASSGSVSVKKNAFINIQTSGQSASGISSRMATINIETGAHIDITNNSSQGIGIALSKTIMNIEQNGNVRVKSTYAQGINVTGGGTLTIAGNLYTDSLSWAVSNSNWGEKVATYITSTAQICISGTNNYFVNNRDTGQGANILDIAAGAKLAFEKNGKTDWYEVKEKYHDENTSATTDNTITADNVKDVLNVEETAAWELPEKVEIDFEDGNSNGETAKQDLADAGKNYQEIINQYDSLIKDASYKGINLLQADKLTVKFNETNTADLSVQGKDMSSQALGFTVFGWETQGDIADSLAEIASALQSIRSYSSELGNNYSIITTRQDFTESLINVLTEGADKLTLADMNEESANMLALQTRQQLAINSLSLASQASQSILKLF